MADKAEAPSSTAEGVVPAIAAAALSVAGAGIVMVVLVVMRDVDPRILLRDPVAQFGLPVYAGFLSYIGVLFLFATAAVTAFVAAVLREQASFFACVAVFSAVLAFDDLFVLHEIVGPRYLGIPERAFMALYAVLALVTLRLLFGQVGIRGSIGLLVALGCLGMSVLLDLAVLDSSSLRVGSVTIPQFVFEDLLKLAGWAAWFGFWMALAFRHMSERIGTAP